MGASVLLIIGLLWLSQLTPYTGYAFIVVPTVFCGLAVGIAFTALNFTVIAGLPPQNAGAAAGMLQTMQQVGGALGLAVLGTVYANQIRGAIHTGSSVQAAVAHGTAAALGAGSAFIVVLLLIGTFALVKPPAPAAQPAPQPAVN